MSAQTTTERITELLALRRKIDAELSRLAGIHQAPTTRNRSKFDIPECGTESAYQRHRYYGEPKDEACRLAHNEHERNRAAIAKERKRAERLAEIRRAA